MTRVKWYHFYIVLAGFDVCIILAGLWLYRKTFTTFIEWRNHIGVSDARQGHLSLLLREVLILNAPGNDVFRTRRVDEEQTRYRNGKARITAMRSRGPMPAADLADFWNEVDAMCQQASRLFATLPHGTASAPAAGDSAAAWSAAGVHMAGMDEHQARAMRLLVQQPNTLINEAAETMQRYSDEIESQARMQMVLVPGVLLALLGMLWYGRTLQRTDEALLAEREHVERERRERLAAIGELCSSVAHGIQNPLAAIGSSAELIRDLGQADGDTRQRAADILNECTRLSQRVTRLLTFARSELRTRRPVRVQDVLAQVLHELHPRFDQRGLRVARTAPEESAFVLADPDELASVLIELLSNALDHCPSGGEVRIRMETRTEQVMLEIGDDGPGVPGHAAEHVFTLFFTTKPGGTGIGLASAKRIVDALDGAIELLPATAGRGATFRVTLPRTRPSEESAAARRAPADA